MRYLLNSAVVTTFGTYKYTPLSREQFSELLRERFVSFVGYPETAEAIRLLTGQSVPLNRGTIKMAPGDEAIVFRLTRRVKNAELKGSLGVQFVLNNCEIGLLSRVA